MGKDRRDIFRETLCLACARRHVRTVRRSGRITSSLSEEHAHSERTCPLAIISGWHIPRGMKIRFFGLSSPINIHSSMDMPRVMFAFTLTE